jgi:hypothetical protein
MLPVVFTQLVEEVSTTGVPQRSFAGAGSITQILKAQSAAAPAATLIPPVNTRTRYVVPIVKAVAGLRFSVTTLVPVAQLLLFAFNVATTQDVVLKICKRGALSMLMPIPVSLIVGFVVCATNEYHTSGEAALPQKAFIPTVAVDETAPFRKLPAVPTQAVPEVSETALLHWSFAGCAIAGRKKNNCIINNSR